VIKKLLAYTILLSMTLHCACRLGVVDRMYKKRNEVAFAMGLIAEIPIAICSSDYKATHNFKQDASDDKDSIPAFAFKTEYINLFFVPAYRHPDEKRISYTQKLHFRFVNLYSFESPHSIFHPPSFVV
jgi:hypothetical protein